MLSDPLFSDGEGGTETPHLAAWPPYRNASYWAEPIAAASVSLPMVP